LIGSEAHNLHLIGAQKVDFIFNIDISVSIRFNPGIPIIGYQPELLSLDRQAQQHKEEAFNNKSPTDTA
jgi:hypothetical protein